MSNYSPVKGRKISNQLTVTGKLKKKAVSEADFGPSTVELDSSCYENLKSHIQLCQSEIKKIKKKRSSVERNAAIRQSQQVFGKKKKKSTKIKKSISAERVKSNTDVKTQEFSYVSPDFIRRKKAATFFNSSEKPHQVVGLQEHRKQLGLNFLNNITTKRLDQILERNRMSSVEKSAAVQHTPEKRRSIFTPNQLQELKHYIKRKKKFQQQIETNKMQSVIVKRQAINENLRSVAEAAKRNSLSNSRSPPRESSHKVSAKPLMLSYVAKKSRRKSALKGAQEPMSLKVQYQQLAERYKNIKIKNSASSQTDRIDRTISNGSYSIRESRDYEQEMRNQGAIIIQRHWRGFATRQSYYYLRQQHLQEMHEREQHRLLFQKEIDQLKQIEQNKWNSLYNYLQEYQNRKNYASVDQLLESLLDHVEFNKTNVFKDVVHHPQQNFKPKVLLDHPNCFPPQIGDIIFLRSELIKEREQKEKQLLKELLIQERISPRSFGQREQQISKWGRNEQDQLCQSKEAIKEGWIKAYETLQKTQKDLRYMQRIGDNQFNHVMALSLSQSNLLKNQLNDLKINLQRNPVADDSSLDIKQQGQNDSSPVQLASYNSNNSNKSLSSYIQGLEVIYYNNKDAPLDIVDDQLSINKIREPQLHYVQTHVAYIRNYLDEIKYIVNESYLDQFQELVNIPIGPNALEILRFFRMTEEMLDQSLDGGFVHLAVLSLDVFTARERLQVGQDEFLIELDRIHNKAIFDAYNEAFDYYRPFGIKGKPLPWRKQFIQREIKQFQEILNWAEEKVIGWSESLCGLLLPQLVGKSQFDNDILPQIREERLDRMLHQEIMETDDRWQEYDEELTEVTLELSETVFDALITEILGELFIPNKTDAFRVQGF